MKQKAISEILAVLILVVIPMVTGALLYVIAIGGALLEGFELIVALASAQTRYSY